MYHVNTWSTLIMPLVLIIYFVIFICTQNVDISSLTLMEIVKTALKFSFISAGLITIVSFLEIHYLYKREMKKDQET